MTEVRVVVEWSGTYIHVTEAKATAAWLYQIGQSARPCDRQGCKRPFGHNGTHYFSYDDCVYDPHRLNQ